MKDYIELAISDYAVMSGVDLTQIKQAIDNAISNGLIKESSCDYCQMTRHTKIKLYGDLSTVHQIGLMALPTSPNSANNPQLSSQSA